MIYIRNDLVAPPGYYTKSYYCNNCGATYTQIFKKGQRAVQQACTECEVEPDYGVSKDDWRKAN